MTAVEGSGATVLVAEVREGVHRQQRCQAPPHGCPHKGPGCSRPQQGQPTEAQQQHLQQGLHAAGADAAVIHGLQAALGPGRQAVGCVHGTIEMQPAADPHAEGDHQGRLGQQTAGREQQPQARLQGTDQRPHPGGEAGDALETRLEPWRQRQHAVEDPRPRQIRQPAGPWAGRRGLGRRRGHGSRRRGVNRLILPRPADA